MMIVYLVAYHALSTPRTAHMPLTSSLRQHGLVFFLLVFFLRLGGMFAAVYLRPSLVFLSLLYALSDAPRRILLTRLP